jgi:hypothetical protein
MNHFEQLTTDPRFDLHWQMTNCERFALQGLLQRLSPELAIEIGTYQGGSLQVLSNFSERVISVDIDPAVGRDLCGKFKNVEFVSGDSAVLLPDLIERLNAKGENVGFILIDGDHSSEGVKRDIEAVLRLKPHGRVVIVMHDSFNPGCRTGMRMADWSGCPHVHWVELDFIPGVYHYKAHDTAPPRSLWGGFACAILEAQPREGLLTVGESQRELFEAVHESSSRVPAAQRSFCSKVLGRLERMLR